MTTELIPVFPADIGNSPVNAIDARKLHEFLEVGKVYGAWINDRIKQYGFIENQDFVVFSDSGKNSEGRPRKEYHCTISMGKELAMVERNAKGKQARQYFIDCERRLLESKPALPNFDDPIVAAEAWIAERRMKLLAERERDEVCRELAAAQPKVAFHDQVITGEAVMDFPQMFSLLQRHTGQKFTRATFLAFARRHGFACQPNPYNGVTLNRFVPRTDYIGTWFVSELHPNGVTEWMVRPMAIAGIVALIEFDRSNSPLQDDDQEAA